MTEKRIMLGKLVKEEFTTSYVVGLPNGLKLQTYTNPPLLWAEVAEQLLEFVSMLEDDGFEIADEYNVREECKQISEKTT